MASLKDTSITGTLSVSGAPTFTTAVPVASGGTGATSASAALTNLGAQAALVSGTNIKTINSTSILGSGDIIVSGGATGGGTDRIFVENGQTVTTNYTITANCNAMTTGPITIENGVVIEIPDGASWVIL